MTGYITDIKRFAVHDGPGIRTTVFLKGCSLSCIWCHNPESILSCAQIGYYGSKCIHCKACVQVCPIGAHIVSDSGHIYDRSQCPACGKCVSVCPVGALTYYGRKVRAEQVVRWILEDRNFYIQSGGGATLSGGEPLLQSEFCNQVLRLLKEESIHTALDTSGAVPWNAFENVLHYTDLFLYDIKLMNAERHIQYTGMDNSIILDNLRRLSQSGAAIDVRIPLVPGCNDDADNINQTGDFLSKLQGITVVRILPYHRMALSKYQALGLPDTMPHVESPTDALLESIAKKLSSFGINAVSGRS